MRRGEICVSSLTDWFGRLTKGKSGSLDQRGPRINPVPEPGQWGASASVHALSRKIAYIRLIVSKRARPALGRVGTAVFGKTQKKNSQKAEKR